MLFHSKKEISSIYATYTALRQIAVTVVICNFSQSCYTLRKIDGTEIRAPFDGP